MPENIERFSKWAIRLSQVVWAIAALVYTYKIATTNLASDFDVYYRTSLRLASRLWNQIYLPSDYYGMFRYPPITLPFFLPFSWVGPVFGRVCFYWLNLGCVFAGLFLLGKSLGLERKRLDLVLWVGALLTLRFFIDSFMMGQVVGLMFFGLCLFVYGLVRQRAWFVALGLMIPVSMKMGFILLAPLLLIRGFKFAIKSSAWIAAMSAALIGTVWVWVGGAAHLAEIFAGWNLTMQTVIDPNSEHYFFCRDFRSQAINSALLRMVGWGWFHVRVAYAVWQAISWICLAALVGFWVYWKYRTRHQKVVSELSIFFLVGQGIMAYLLLMPWSYRHTLSLMLVPLVGLLASEPWKAKSAVFWFVALSMSFAGSSLVGYHLFFWIQELSIPVIAMIAFTWILTVELLRKLPRLQARR